MATNIITAQIKGRSAIADQHAYQYDYGMILKISGVDLPAAYQVDFSNEPIRGTAYQQIGNADGVAIPDACFESGDDIFAWVYLHSGEDDGETVYQIMIPVYKRSKTSGETPTPAQQSAIDEAIAALNVAVEEAEEARQAIEDMTVSAETLPEGSSATVTKTVEDGVVNLDFGIPKGDTGAQGETGPAGQDGRDGVTPDISIGTVSTLPAGSSATASITGTTEEPVLNLGIPQGQQGETGATGPIGATPNLTIGTVSTLPAGSDATATITGTPENPVLSLGIPKGDTGEVSQADLTAALLNKADVITDTASGTIVSIPDGMASPVLGLDVDIEPIQDLHGYDNPWPAGGGKNLLDPARRTNLSLNVHLFYDSTGFLLKANTAYTLSLSTASAQTAIDDVDGNRLAVNYGKTSITYTPTADVYAKFDIFFNSGYPAPSGGTADVLIQLELGSTATAYTPYSNICPISGRSEVIVTRTGANVYDEQYESGYYDIADGTAKSSSNWARSKNPIPCKPQTQYCFVYNGTSTESMGYMLFYKADGTYLNTYTQLVLSTALNGQVFTTPDNAEIIKFYSKPSHFSGNLSINHPSTIHTYNQYQAKTVTIQLGQTVYGGSVDVTEGKLTITHKTTIADGVNLKVAGVYANSTAYTDNIPDMYNDSSYAHQRDVMVLCDKLKASAYINISSTPYGVSQNGGTRFIFNIPDLTTVAQYNAWVQANTPTVYYLLADPVEVTLTPQELDILFGDNVVFADSGNVSVDYRCDTKKYILKKIAEALNA